jgi:hypothetical protein
MGDPSRIGGIRCEVTMSFRNGVLATDDIRLVQSRRRRRRHRLGARRGTLVDAVGPRGLEEEIFHAGAARWPNG